MKLKILTLLLGVSLLFISCDPTGIKEGSDVVNKTETTYTVKYNIDMSDIWAQLPGATHEESLAIFEYNDLGECVNTQNFKDVHYGSTKTFTASKLAKKLAVYHEVEAEYNGKEADTAYWIQQVFYLEEGGNITINITGELRVGAANPIN